LLNIEIKPENYFWQKIFYSVILYSFFLYFHAAEAGVEMGYENHDCNGATQTGFMLPQATIRRGAR
jgi:hypothetical protein